jgi:hypothetical protein
MSEYKISESENHRELCYSSNALGAFTPSLHSNRAVFFEG